MNFPAFSVNIQLHSVHFSRRCNAGGAAKTFLGRQVRGLRRNTNAFESFSTHLHRLSGFTHFRIFSDCRFVMVCVSTTGIGVAGLHDHACWAGFPEKIWLRQVNHTEICQAECQSSASGTGACSSAWKVIKVTKVTHCFELSQDIQLCRGAVQDAKKAQSFTISKE